MALDEDLYDWALTRPWWQQQALARLNAGQELGEDDFKTIAAALPVGSPTPSEGGWLGMALRPSEDAGESVRLRAVRDVSNVNALVDDQTLTFAPTGLTVVYGGNGSGKSGYARLLKRSVRARHRDKILPDIFDAATGPVRAMIEYSVGDDVQVAGWDQAAPALEQVAFYDEKCGDCYVSMEAEVTYRPAGLQLLDALIEVCDGVRNALELRLTANARDTISLPAPPGGTPSADFLAQLRAGTSDEEIAAACTFTEANADELERSLSEESRLRTSNATQEKARLVKLAAVADAVADSLHAVEVALGADAEAELRRLVGAAADKRAAAAVASSLSFDAEPVPGVGTGTWRALWQAARAFAEETYPDRPFPAIAADARCPLCQQDLDEAAADRLHRFHAYMSDTTETEARAAERAVVDAVAVVGATATLTPQTAVYLEALRAADPEAAASAESAFVVMEARRAALSELPAPVVVPVAPDTFPVRAELSSRAAALRAQAEGIDATQFTTLLAAAVARREGLEARRLLAEHRGGVVAERDRRQERARLEAARDETVTTGVTRKSTELTRAYVTAAVQDRFSRESDRLGVERVALTDTGGRKGQLMHRPTFLGAAVRAELPHVLSEGEQTALGLAGFFTEVYFDTSGSALVLDDPVTSLDHMRRDKVASRLVEFARDRQVIVFTHDVAFVTELRRYAGEKAVTFTERGVERRIYDDAPGMCIDAHPWNAKDAAARLDWLTGDLARLRRESNEWDRATYEQQTALWAGALSETWERIVSMEIANQLVDRSKLEVRPTMMKVVARITEQDEKEFQESYARCSKWLKRHDKDQALNYVAPTLDELEVELDLVKAWFARVRKYKQ